MNFALEARVLALYSHDADGYERIEAETLSVLAWNYVRREYRNARPIVRITLKEVR